MFPKCLLVSAQGWMQCSCKTIIRWLRRAGWDGDEANLFGTFLSLCGSKISIKALWIIAGVVLSSWPWSWPWLMATDLPHRLGFALSLKSCLTIRHLVHNAHPSPSLLIRCCGTVPLDEFLLCWPLSLLAPSCLLDLIIPWHLRSCKILSSKLEKFQDIWSVIQYHSWKLELINNIIILYFHGTTL